MQRLKCTIAYDGSQFNGFQTQTLPNQRTVQGYLEKALMKIHKGHHVAIYASGRTDSGVHAYGQVIHFDSPLDIPANRWPAALNSIVPGDIVIKEVVQVDPTFHARYDVTSKEYRYKILRSKQYDVFTRKYVYHYPYPLDLSAMKMAKEYLIGTHDFTSFCSAKTAKEDKVRTIYYIDLYEENDELILHFNGSGFLYNMVRILVGTLLKVGQGKIKPQDIKTILEQKNRMLAGQTAPSHGLYLWQVNYDN
ncbi:MULTISPECIES: tRNA pseudouridine(38-40) synthase TruA [Bacillaceae]|uniref:tRNA pseudouridine(38-40) synthase TruA n=1 Tax=Bacillaceae TaxID=186817 RepID=UPI002A0B2588|nr:tRNA pseudouridine(38-40) synthase TruA [Cytobacillus sp. IB215316]MDX8363044.1 tRNA pseudouridine(38-40) synthase TruA [Cytobacillus sp. IB215316]